MSLKGVTLRAYPSPEASGGPDAGQGERQGELLTEDGERRANILLKPDGDDPPFGPIVLTPENEAEVRVIAELVRVLDAGS